MKYYFYSYLITHDKVIGGLSTVSNGLHSTEKGYFDPDCLFSAKTLPVSYTIIFFTEISKEQYNYFLNKSDTQGK